MGRCPEMGGQDQDGGRAEALFRTSTERDEEHTRPRLRHQSNMVPLHCARGVTAKRG
jgi:hypothetical protein